MFLPARFGFANGEQNRGARRERAFFSRRAKGAGLFHVLIVGIDHVAVKAGIVVRAAALGLRIGLRLLIELF